MKLVKKLLAGAAVAAVMAGSAQAYTVDGVTWDPTVATDFSNQSINMRQTIDTQTGTLSGYGIITALNGSSDFCAGCQLTFQYSGFTPTSGVTLPGVGSTVNYSGGVVNFYVRTAADGLIANPSDYNALTAANTISSTLFLSTVEHVSSNGSSASFTGTNTGNSLLSGLGFLDIVGGNAASLLNTNTIVTGLTNGGVVDTLKADLALTTSLSFLHNGITDISGTGNLVGKSVTAVPEPSSFVMLGLGLVGIGAARRRKSAK